jgi:acyl carrier protein
MTRQQMPVLTHEEIVEVVLAILREIVGRDLAGPVITAQSYLFDLPGFDSISLAELVGRLEAQAGPLPEELLMPEVFRTPADIATALAAAASAGRQR